MVGFSTLARILGECSLVHFLPVLLRLLLLRLLLLRLLLLRLLLLLLLVEISWRTLAPLSTPGSVHSGSES